MKLVSARAMRSLDRKAVKDYGIRGIQLMENAGRALADVALEMIEDVGGSRVSIVAGKGNNGGDGFVCARFLKNFGLDVKVFSTARIEDFKGDALVNARLWKKMGGETAVLRTKADLKKNRTFFTHSQLIVDALLGTGLSSDVRGVCKSAIEFINALGKKVVAADVPSGIDATTGMVHGIAVRADVTVTMALSKPGLHLHPGSDYSGEVEVVEIGMPGALIDNIDSRWSLITAGDAGRLLSPRERDCHKGSFGHVAVIGGSPGKTGAPYMAAMGAMRSGVGLVTIGVAESLSDILEVKTSEVMTAALMDTPERTLGELSVDGALTLIEGKDAVVIGPGLGAASEQFSFLEGLLLGSKESLPPVLLDADALNVFSGRSGRLKKIGSELVLTPHPAEAARLLGSTTKEVLGDRVAAAEKISRLTAATVVLKGTDTIVVSPEGRVAINPTGTPALASAGTGDVLSGIIGTFLAQGYAPFDAARLGVYLHGLSGLALVEKEGGAIGHTATDLLTVLPGLINSFDGDSTPGGAGFE